MIDYKIIDSGKFPILKIINCIPKDKLIKIKEEIKTLEPEFFDSDEKDHVFSRFAFDDYYINDRMKSYTLQNVGQMLFSNEMLEIYNTINETAFKLLHTSTTHETQLTIYGNNNEYKWHNDDIHFRLVNWVLFIDMDSDFTGGENEISNSVFDEETDGCKPIHADIVTKHEDNVLIMMPCWVTHRVAPVFCKSKDRLKGRMTINGHIGYLT